MKLKAGQLVKVDWVDSVSPVRQNWMDPERISVEIDGCQSVGWIHRVNKKVLTLVHTRDGSNICGAITIPRVAITAVKQLGGR